MSTRKKLGSPRGDFFVLVQILRTTDVRVRCFRTSIIRISFVPSTTLNYLIIEKTPQALSRRPPIQGQQGSTTVALPE